MRIVILASAGLLALSACSGGHKDEEVLTDNGEAANVVMENSNDTAPPPAAIVENASNSELPAPPPAFTNDQQTRDDADASGLTARLPDEEAQPGQDGNQVRQGE